MNCKLTKAQVDILRYYKSIGVTDKENGGLRFCRSIKTIADETDTGTKTVQRANDRFQSLGILIWEQGHGSAWCDGQPNRYLLSLNGIHGYYILGVTPAILRSIRSQIVG